MLIHQSYFRGQKLFFHISMVFLETTYISFLYNLPEDPTKVLTKGRFDKGYKMKISSLNQAPPKLYEQQDFLTNDRNKEQLCSVPAGCFVSDKIITGKTIYVSKGSLCLMKTLHNGQQIANELCSNYREVNDRYAQSQKYCSTLYKCYNKNK